MLGERGPLGWVGGRVGGGSSWGQATESDSDGRPSLARTVRACARERARARARACRHARVEEERAPLQRRGACVCVRVCVCVCARARASAHRHARVEEERVPLQRRVVHRRHVGVQPPKHRRHVPLPPARPPPCRNPPPPPPGPSGSGPRAGAGRAARGSTPIGARARPCATRTGHGGPTRTGRRGLFRTGPAFGPFRPPLLPIRTLHPSARPPPPRPFT